MPPLRGCAGYLTLGFLGLTPQAIACRRSAAARLFGDWIPGVNTPGYRMPPLRGSGYLTLGFLGLTPQAIACRRSAAARVIVTIGFLGLTPQAIA